MSYEYTESVWNFWEKLLYKFNPKFKSLLKTIPMVDIEEGIDAYLILEFKDGYKVENLQLKTRSIPLDENVKSLRNYTVNLAYETEDGYPCAFGRYFKERYISLFAFGFPKIGFGVIFTYKAFKEFWYNFEPQSVHEFTYSNGTKYYEVSLAEIIHNMKMNKDYWAIRDLTPIDGEILM